MRRVLLAMLTLAAFAGTLAVPPRSWSQTSPGLSFIGFSRTIPPGESLEFRLALAYAIDKAAVAKVVTGYTSGGARAAAGLQHPSLPGYNAAVRGHAYDPTRARQLYAQSGWTAAITIMVGPGTGYAEALNVAVSDSVQRSLGVHVGTLRISSFEALVRETRAGRVPIWMYGWRGVPRDFGYPSFALGLADAYFLADPEIKALVEKRDVQALEQMLLERALIIPVVFY